MTTKTQSAGDRLRADLDEALRAASEEAGRALEFDEAERHLVDQAAASAELSAEIRLCEKQAVDFVARVKLILGQGIKSPQHQRAAQARWQAQSRQHR